jgi:hypothetical protein
MLSSIGLAIGLPFCGRPISPEWAMSFANQNYPMNTMRYQICIKGQEIGLARNEIVKDALNKRAKYLWFLDDDVALPFHGVRSLLHTLENSGPEVMVAAGIYCEKSMPTEPVVFRGHGVGPFWHWKAGDVFECTGIGTGCMLIKMEVFEHLKEPYFQTIDGSGTPEQPWDYKTDDLYFCDQVINSGFKILADSNVMCVHWKWEEKLRAFQHYILPEDCYPMRPVTDAEPRCVRKFKFESEVEQETQENYVAGAQG